MVWPIITAQEIFDRVLHDWRDEFYASKKISKYACAWVEAESILLFRSVVQKWYERLEDGVSDSYEPDPFWTCPSSKNPLTPELAEHFISEMDADFDLELPRTSTSGRNISAAMKRLSPRARLAFMQEIYFIPVTKVEIIAEAAKRLANGEKLPPTESSKPTR